MRIAMLSPPWISVPPVGYGGIEWVVHLLTEELVARGHDVTMFATGDSRTKAELRSVFDDGQAARMHETRADSMHAGAAFGHIAAEASLGRAFDVVHDHTAWLGVAFAAVSAAPVVHTVHGPFTAPNREFYARFQGDASLVLISEYQRRAFPEVRAAGVVHNAVDVGAFPFRPAKDDYVVSLGRVTRDKGQGLAVQAALKAGVPLVIAGKIDPGDDVDYFEEAVRPFVDGQNIRFEGEVPDDRKRELLAGARALLFPIQWPEPFGLVMIEAMACGTPVIAFPNGAVPEVVVDGRTGFLVSDEDAMVAAIGRLGEIDPTACREHVERRFSPAVMADGYERIYEAVARQR